ncbi:MAG: ABC transporter ATP-binding protein [Propionibacteriaceae bacterium]
MHDFPPVVSGSPRPATPTGLTGARPDTRTPARFLFWMLRQQGDVLAATAGTSVLWFLPSSFGPFLVGRAVDQGIVGGSGPRLALWTSLLVAGLVVSSVFGVLMHSLTVRGWLLALYRTTKLVTQATTELGHVLPQRTPTGEVLSVASSDSDQFGALTDAVAVAVGAAVAYLTVAVLVLTTSVPLGIVILVAAPVLIGLALPLLRPLHARQGVERRRSSELTSMATDIVAGLRILRGIGGERTFGRNYTVQSQKVRAAGVAAGTLQSVVDAVGVLFAGLFLVTLTWLGAREVVMGQLSVGELISLFGYALFMIWPIQTFFELAQKWVRALVSADRAVAVLSASSPWADPGRAVATPPVAADLIDQRTGFVARPGELTVVVSARPDDSAELADRLGRYLVVERDPVSSDFDDTLKGRAAREARIARDTALDRLEQLDREQAAGTWGVTLGGVDLADVELSEVRRRILVSDTQSQLFAGTLREAIDPHDRLSRAQAEEALYTAAAEDVFEALPGGWQGRLDEKGRGLSGGQRQRVVLARALATDPEILVLVEPTSAVDAHTEAAIASRLADLRRGRTTVVMTVSPLLLHHADRVVLLWHDDKGVRVAASGTHDDLLHDSSAYREVVVRGLEIETAQIEQIETAETSEGVGR